MKSLIEKYKPSSLKEIQANIIALSTLRNFILKKSRKKAALIYGPTGTGKTISVYALANDLRYEILEINASDHRNKDNIEGIVNAYCQQASLISKDKLILIDDIDSLSANDRGCIPALIKSIENSRIPILFTAIDPWSQKLNDLRKTCELIEFKTIDSSYIFKTLKMISTDERFDVDDDSLILIAKRSNGDIRAAINDLQSLSENSNFNSISERDRKEDIFNALKTVFQSNNVNDVIRVQDRLDMDLEEFFFWIDENLPLEYKDEDLKKAYEYMSRADVFKGRITKWQYYRFLVYLNELMTAGVNLAKSSNTNRFVRYKMNMRFLRLWRAKMKNAKKAEICEKISKELHMSKRKAIKEFGYIKFALKNKDVIKSLNLEKEQMDFIAKI